MLTPQEWSIKISNAKRQVHEDSLKVPRSEDVRAIGNDTGVSAQVLANRLDDFESAFNNLVAAVTELSEQLDKAQGMLRYCYAICQNPGIKALADSNKESPTARLSSLRERGMAHNRTTTFGGSPQPRPGLGGAGRP